MNSSVAAGTERSTILASHPDPLAPCRANPFRHIRFGALLCLIGVLGSGCIFSPEKGKKPPVEPPAVYPKRDTPKNAVLFLTVAWTNRDSAQIDTVYADDYEGSSVDLTDANPQPLPPFTKSDEVRAVGALALNQAITRVNMQFNSPNTWDQVHYTSDPPDWQTVQVHDFSIVVNDGENEYRVTSPSPSLLWVFEFTLRPTYPNGQTEPVWEIVRWVESRQNT